MKKNVPKLTAAILALTLITGEAFAQRGRGGGRPGGGRVGGGARPSINRSPSMSRPSTPRRSVPRPNVGGNQRPPVGRPSAPSRPATGQLPAKRPGTGTAKRPSTPVAGARPGGGAQRPPTGQRPTSGQLQDFLNMPKVGGGNRPSAGRGPGASQLPSTDRSKIRDSIGVGAGQRPSMPDWFQPGASQLPGAGKPGTPPGAGKPGTLPGTGKPPAAGKPPGSGKPGRPPGVRPPARPPVVRPPVGRPPRPWYPGRPGYRPGHWWRWATAGAITGWVVHRWTNPIYYSYGSGGTVYYENNVVYVNGEEQGSAEEYYQGADQLATSVPEMTDAQAEEVEWMPLGVFALTAEGVNASSMFLQLALSKEGIIAGTFYNESTGATHPVEGMVDQKTQRAVWKAADGTNPNLVMETGVYNLTQDKTETLVHFGPEQTQTWLMVRLDESERPESK